MTEEQLKKATALKKQIDEIEKYIFLASRDGFWEKIAFKKETSLITNVLGYRDDTTEYRLSKDLSLKVIEVLKKQKEEWEEELKSL